MAKQDRKDLIQRIEEKRDSRLLCYFLSDRPGASANISDDAIRTMAEHVRRFGKIKKLDLFLYSRGGSVDAPWPIICLLREYCEILGVLIPFRAHSAATLLALGCDEIMMTRQAELGPIDPAFNRVTPQEGGTVVQEEIRVEDVMSYVGFIKEKAGLGDQTALAASIGILAEKLSPQVVGSIYRTHSHIRVVARKLLASRAEKADEQRLGLIVESLAEKTHSHGHAVGRKEAKELGLPVGEADEALEELLWSLLGQYEATLDMRRPIDPEAALQQGDEAEAPCVIGMIESLDLTYAFRGQLKVRRVRQAPQQVNINLNLGVSLPPGIAPDQVPQAIIQQILQQAQQGVPAMVMDQVKRQSPILRIEARLVNGYWQDVSGEDL